MKEYISAEMCFNFSRNLRCRLAELDLKQNDLAMMTGISETAISRYLNRVLFPNDSNLLRIANVLDCEIEDLLEPIDISEEWVTIRSHPNYEINSDFEVRNKRTGRILRNQVDDRNRLIIQIDGKTEKVLTLYDRAFGTHDFYAF